MWELSLYLLYGSNLEAQSFKSQLLYFFENTGKAELKAIGSSRLSFEIAPPQLSWWLDYMIVTKECVCS